MTQTGFRCFLSLAFTSLVMTPTVSMGDHVDVWFGTVTNRHSESQGIYHATLDTDDGALSKVTLAASCQSPGFLALHPSGQVIYSTGSPTDGGEVSAFRLAGAKGERTLELIGSVASGGGSAAHLSTDHAGKVLLSAQYGGGSTSLYELDDQGAIKRRVVTKRHASLLPQAGSQVVAKRQDAPHAHWSGTSPDDRFAFVPDLGMDKVVIWQFGASQPELTHHGFGECLPGSGPRHMKFTPDGSRIYVLNELMLSITVFDYDADQGTMVAGQTIATLSDEIKSKETFNSASEIRIHPSGRFVYSANRGHDSISVFSVNEDGVLSLVEVEPIRGGWPRNFEIDPTGKWIIAAGQESNTATVFRIEQETGELTFIRQTQSVPAPICVLFGKL